MCVSGLSCQVKRVETGQNRTNFFPLLSSVFTLTEEIGRKMGIFEETSPGSSPATPATFLRCRPAIRPVFLFSGVRWLVGLPAIPALELLGTMGLLADAHAAANSNGLRIPIRIHAARDVRGAAGVDRLDLVRRLLVGLTAGRCLSG